MISEVAMSQQPSTEGASLSAPNLPFRNSVHLTQAEAHALMHRMLSGSMQPEEIAAVLQYLRRKGETLGEVVGFAAAIRELSEPLELDIADGNATVCFGGFSVLPGYEKSDRPKTRKPGGASSLG